MPEHNQGQMGGTMRLGKRKTIFKKDSILSKKDFKKQTADKFVQ
jgi:CTP synthase